MSLPSGEVRSVLSYSGDGKRLLAALKYRNRRGVVEWLAGCIAHLTRDVPVDAVTWIPASRQGVRERGFDLGRLMAKAVAPFFGVPCLRMLVRGAGPRQSIGSRVERLAGPALHARVRRLQPRNVLLVDDVCTTGTSLARGTSVLLDSGVQRVVSVVAAITPLR